MIKVLAEVPGLFCIFSSVKKLSFIAFLILMCNAYSQVVGTQFALDKSYYRSKINLMTGMGPGGPVLNTTYSNYYVKGDTVISNKYCQKVYYNNYTVFDTACPGALKIMYYDGGKLYLENKLLYNFSLMVNDTFSVYYSSSPTTPSGMYMYTVTVKDSVNIGTKWRKRLTLASASTMVFSTITWVDGIGDINIGFNGDYGIAKNAVSFWGSYILYCFSENFQSTYGSGCGVSSICLSTNINESDVIYPIKLYPNPVNDVLNVLGTENKFLNLEIQITDLLGQRIIRQAYNKQQVDVSSLPVGCYFVKLISEDGTILHSKFVKE